MADPRQESLELDVPSDESSIYACVDCGDEHPLAKFRRHPTNRLGYQLICTNCSTAVVRRTRGVETKASYFRPRPEDRCGICGAAADLHLDHDHASGEFRGWLCPACNTGLGSFGDDPSRLESAIRYLTADTS